MVRVHKLRTFFILVMVFAMVRGAKRVDSWRILSALVQPDLILASAEDANVLVADMRSRHIVDCNHAVSISQNDSFLENNLKATLGRFQEQRAIISLCPDEATLKFMDAVAKIRLSNWQWNWVLAFEDADIIPFDLHNLGDEWGIAVAKQSSDNSAGDSVLSPGTEMIKPLLESEVKLAAQLHIYAFLPVNKNAVRRIGRQAKHVARFDKAMGALFIERNVYKLKDLERNESVLESARTHLKSKLFPSPFVTYKNLRGRALVTSTINDPPFFKFLTTNCLTDPSQTCLPQSGIDYALMEVLGQALNFSQDYVTPPDGQWGVRRPNGSWTGLVGDVASGRADFAACHITVNQARRAAVDFTYGYFYEGYGILTKAPKDASRAFVVLKPFDLRLWLTIIATATGSAWLLRGLYLAEKLLKGRPPHEGKTIPAADDSPVAKYALEAMKHLVGLGDPFPCHDAMKVFLLFWMTYATIISALYRGVLTSYMNFPEKTATIDSLEDLKAAAEKKSIVWGVLKGSSALSLFKDAEKGIYYELYQTMKANGENRSLSATFQEGTRRVMNSEYALIRGALTLKQFMADNGWDRFHLSKEGFHTNYYGVVLPKGSPLQPVIDRKIFQLMSGGIIHKWTNDVLQQAMIKRMNSVDTVDAGDQVTGSRAAQRPLTLDDLQGAFIILGSGIFLANAALLLEIVKKNLACLVQFARRILPGKPAFPDERDGDAPGAMHA